MVSSEKLMLLANNKSIQSATIAISQNGIGTINLVLHICNVSQERRNISNFPGS